MPMDRFLIAPFDKESGLQTDVRPWLIPDLAFEQLQNAYVFRGRVRKRFGSKWLEDDSLGTRLRVQVGVTESPSGNLIGFVPRVGNVPIVTPAVGQMFSIGSQVFTVNVLGAPAELLISGTATGALFDTSSGDPDSGQFIFIGATPNTPVYYYPALPVMGLLEVEGAGVNNESVIAFDTKFAYQYVSGWERLANEDVAGSSVWNGTNYQFFWGNTWTGTSAADRVFFVTNFNPNEPNHMRYFFNTTWYNFLPQISDSLYVFGALIIIPFRNRLVLLNTWEGPSIPGTNYQNRARWCQVGNPLASDAWRFDIPGKGSAIDASTTEAIVSAEFIRDRLIVYFERSTWELAFTGNQAQPFTWYKINTELGASGTFTIVPFDKVVLAVANVGIHACSGTSVDRIDQRIPDVVFEDIAYTNQGGQRVYGIRDYFVEQVYWAYPDNSRTDDNPWPNQVLVYNYKTGTWAINDDSITVFGYFQPIIGVTWDSTTVTWDSDVSWDSGMETSPGQTVCFGNQEGYVLELDPDLPYNAPALQITNISNVGNTVTINAIDHNLALGSYIYIVNVVGTGTYTELNNTIYEVDFIIDKDNFTIIYIPDPDNLSGVYAGAGLIARVTNVDILTKEFNFYFDKARNVYVSKVDFQVDSTSSGALTIDYFVSTNQLSLLQESNDNGTNLGTNVLETTPYPTVPFEQLASRLVHPVYFQADGEFIQLRITLSADQTMEIIPIFTGEDITGYTGPSLVDFQLHSMQFWCMPSTNRNQ